MKTQEHRFSVVFPLALNLLLVLLISTAFGQPVNIVTPASHQSFKLADPATLQTEADAHTAIASAESAGKALAADLDVIKKEITPAQTDFSKAETLRSNYVTAITAFNKNDVEPYKQDLDKYNTAGKKYTDALGKYNKSAQANNAMLANKRRAATVAVLNRQKLQVDSMGKQLGDWKTRLDAAKAKLDVKNATLNKQQQQYQSAEQGATARLSAIKARLKDIQSMLNMCAVYAARCNSLLSSKFNQPALTYKGYFTSPEYKKAVSDVNLQLVGLQMF